MSSFFSLPRHWVEVCPARALIFDAHQLDPDSDYQGSLGFYDSLSNLTTLERTQRNHRYIGYTERITSPSTQSIANVAKEIADAIWLLHTVTKPRHQT